MKAVERHPASCWKVDPLPKEDLVQYWMEGGGAAWAAGRVFQSRGLGWAGAGL